MKPDNQIIGLSTLSIKATSPSFLDTPLRAIKKRIFSEDEISYLNTRSLLELEHRQKIGRLLIGLLHRPEMINMTTIQANQIASNLHYQIDAIQQIIDARGGNNKEFK